MWEEILVVDRIKDLLKNIKLFKSLVINDFNTRYNGSAFGSFWGFVNPIITICVYWFVFTVGLRSGLRADGTPYILWLIAGMVPWFFISEALISMSNSFVEYGYLVKKVNFNILLIPLIKLGSAIIMHAFFLVVSIIIFNVSGYYLSIYYLQLLYYFFGTVVLLLGTGLFLSSIIVFFRDISQVVSIVIQIGFWAVPIVWSSDLLPLEYLPFFKLNPVFYIVEGYRESLLLNIPICNHAVQGSYFWLVSMLLGWLGIYTFKRLKPYFSDVL